MAVGRYGQVAVEFKCNIECFLSGGFQTDRCLQVTGKFRWPLGQFRLYVMILENRVLPIESNFNN